MKTIDNLRAEVDSIDEELNKLFIKRLEVVSHIREEKKLNSMDILDKNREDKIFTKLKSETPEEYFKYSQDLFQSILRISMEFQGELR